MCKPLSFAAALPKAAIFGTCLGATALFGMTGIAQAAEVSFDVHSNAVAVPCGRDANVDVGYTAPPGATIVKAQARWIELVNADNPPPAQVTIESGPRANRVVAEGLLTPDAACTGRAIGTLALWGMIDAP
jgi:hypothetical protein